MAHRFGKKVLALLLIISLISGNLLFASLSLTNSAEANMSRRAKITSLQGSVLIQASGQAITVPARTGMDLSSGDRIITGSDGRAEIRFDDGSTSRIAPNTRVDIGELSRDSATGTDTTTLNNRWGELWNNTRGVFDRNSRFEVNTPTAVAGVRGTDFLVRVEEGEETLVRAYSGLVGVSQFPDEGEPVGFGLEQQVPATAALSPNTGTEQTDKELSYYLASFWKNIAQTTPGGETLLGPFQQTRSKPLVPPPPDPDPVDPLDVGDFEKDNLVEDQPEAYAEVGYQASELLAQQAEEHLNEEAKKLAQLQRELVLLQEKMDTETDPERLEMLLALQKHLNSELDLTFGLIENILQDRDEYLQNKDMFAELKEQAELLDPDELRERAREVREKEKERDAERKDRQEASQEKEQDREEARRQAEQEADDLGLREALQEARDAVTNEDIDNVTEEIMKDLEQLHETIVSGEDDDDEDTDTDRRTTRPRVSLDVDEIVLPEGTTVEIEINDVVDYFSELSSNATSFSVSSDNHDVVEITESMFIITGEPGEAEITLTASRSGYRSRTRTFTVTVEEEVVVLETPDAGNSEVTDTQDNEDGIATLEVFVANSEGIEITGLLADDFAIYAEGTTNVLGTIVSVEPLEVAGYYEIVWEYDDGTHIVDLEVDGIVIEENLEVTISTVVPGTEEYTVSFSVVSTNGENGGLTAWIIEGESITSGQEVEAGVGLEFEAFPDTDYQVKEWTINGDVVADYTSDLFTIAYLEESVDATVEFEEIDPESNGFAGGEGTEAEPFQIATAEQLNNVRNHMDAHYVLIDHIDLTDYLSPEGDGYNEGDGWEPIGTFVSVGDQANEPFTGTFNGFFDDINYTISGLSIDREEENGVGLFGFTGASAKISNIILSANDVAGGDYVGILVGTNYGEVENCHVSGSVSGDFVTGGLLGENMGPVSESSSEANVDGNDQVGGLIGTGYGGGDIYNCYATGNVEGLNNVGGLIGFIWDGVNVTGSFATGDISGGEEGESIGGLAGHNEGNITECYATGEVSGYDNVGGLVGRNEEYATIARSYSTSSVSGWYAVGGLVGISELNSTISNCYAVGSVQGMSDAGGLVGANLSVITNCYAIGPVDVGELNYGGLIGSNDGTVINSYYNTETTGRDDSSGGLPRTTVQMEFPYDLGNEPGIGDSWSFYWDDVEATSEEDDWHVDIEYIVDSAVVHNGTRYYCIAKHWSSSASTFNDWDFSDIWQIDEETMPDGVHFFPYLIDNSPVPIALP